VAERRNGKAKVALARLVISVVLAPVPASASITDSYGCTEYAAQSGYEGAKEGLLTYYGTANAETWTYGHATGACRNISSVAVEAGLYQWRWTGSDSPTAAATTPESSTEGTHTRHTVALLEVVAVTTCPERIASGSREPRTTAPASSKVTSETKVRFVGHGRQHRSKRSAGAQEGRPR